MKHFPRWTVRVSALILILAGPISAWMPVHADQVGDAASAATLYTASDFTELAQGVDAGFAGPATLRVWAPPGDLWRLTEADGVITLSLASKEGDPEPQWRTLGSVTLAARPSAIRGRLSTPAMHHCGRARSSAGMRDQSDMIGLPDRVPRHVKSCGG